jgi:protein subunit release factor B
MMASVIQFDPELSARVRRLGLNQDDFAENFARSSGPGGQNVNKVSTSVTLVHEPSGISVTAQETRSQYRNRQLASERLVTLLEQRRQRDRAERKAAASKERRRHSPRPRSLKRKIRETKERRSQVKQGRSKQKEE